MQTHLRIAKNAVANLTRGAAGAVVALVLPAFLVRHLNQVTYGVWVLVLQVAAYLAYLDFGLQTAIGRYVAFANEKKDPQLRDSIFSTAFLGLSIAACLGVLLLVSVVALSPRLFPQVPSHLMPQMRWALLIVGSSLALALPASAWNGVFVGLQRNELIAIIGGGAKLLSAVGLAYAAYAGYSIIGMAAVMAAANLASYAMQFGAFQRVASEISFQLSLVSRKSAKELVGYCASLTVWSVSMMLVTGLDLVLVARFQFSAVAPYAVAASFVAFLAGAQTAVFGAMMPHAAAVHAQQDPERLGRMVIVSTRIGVLLLVLTGMPLLICAEPILRLWVGTAYAAQGHHLLVILLIANMIRLIGVPYCVVLVGAGQQRLVVVSPLVEGFTNALASILLGIHYGAVGVAVGTLIGSLVGTSANFFYNVPRTYEHVRLRATEYFFSGVGLPALFAIPFIFLRFTVFRNPANIVVGAIAVSVVSLVGVVLARRQRLLPLA